MLLKKIKDNLAPLSCLATSQKLSFKIVLTIWIINTYTRAQMTHCPIADCPYTPAMP